MTAKLAKIVLSIIAGMFGLVLVMSMLAGAGPAAAREDIGQDSGGALAAGTPSDVVVDASPGEIRADGESNSTITGTVRDSGCMTVAGAFIAFTTDLGSIDQICYAEAEDASVNKSPGDWITEDYPGASGGYYVKACGTVHPNATLSWTFTATAISMLYVKDPEGGVAEVQVDGSTAITVDTYADPKTAAERVLTAGLGSGSHVITVKYLTRSPVGLGSCIRIDAFRCGATTDSHGQGTATLTSTILSCGSEDATVTALTGDPSIPYMILGTMPLGVVKMTASVPDSVTVTANPDQIAAGGVSTSILEAAVKDQFGEYMPNCTMVSFVTDRNGSDPPGVWAILPYELVEGEDPTEVITSSSWSTGTNSLYHGGEVISSTTAGATASWSFTGTSVSLMYAKLSDAGVATVTVDSGLPITIDMYAPSPGQYQVEHVITHGLSSGQHVIMVTVAGYTLGGTDTCVYLDAFRSGTSTSGGTATTVLTSGTKAGMVMVEATGVGRQCCETDSVVTDTVPITLTAGDPYTLTITPTDVHITCCITSTLQFTVTDQYSNVVGAVVPKTLTVDFTSTPSGDFTPSSVEITNGVGSVEFHGRQAGIGTITGTVQVYGVVGTSNLTIAPASCDTLAISVDRARLYVTDTNTSLLTDFIYTTTITAELKDGCDNPVQNNTVVTFTTSLGDLGSDTITKGTISGLATAVLTSEQLAAGVPTRTAYITVTGTSCPVSDTTSVDFGRHVYTLTVTADPDEMTVGGDTSALTADVDDGFGDPTPDGVRVSFTITLASMAWVPPGYVETEGGAATVTATSGTQAGVATIEAAATGSTVTNTGLITITAGDPYTLTITPAGIDTTCCLTSTLQFTVTDQYSNVVGAVVPKTLTVDFTSAPYGIFTPTSVVVTDGVGSVIFHGWTEGSGTITGTVQVYGVVGTSNLTIAPASCDTLTISADRARLHVTDTNTSLLTDFIYTTTITAELKDSCDNPVQNNTVVTFTTSLGNVSPANPTTVNGLATAVLTSENLPAGVPTETAYITVTGASCPISDTTSVDFGRHVYTLTVTADPDEMTVGGDTSDLTADVDDGFGDPTPDGVRVSFTITLASMASVPPGYVETEGGAATVTATSGTQAGVATIEAAATGSIVTNTTLITITAGDPYTLTITPTDVHITCCVTNTLQFTVTDQYSNVLGAVSPRPVTVCFYCDPGSLVDSWSPASCVEVTNGVGSVEFHGWTSGTGTIAGYVQGFSYIQDTSNITVAVGSPGTLDVTRAPETILADGFETAIITATVKDSCENPVCNRIVTFTADAGSFEPPPDTTLSITKTTNCSGIATATLRSVCVSRRANVTVTVDSLTRTTYVDMVGVAWDMQLAANPTSIQVGGHTSNLTATVNDQFGHAVLDGTLVIFTTNLGSLGSDTITKATTSGVATAILTSLETAGTDTITATAGSGVDAATDTVTVTFEAGPAYTVTLEAHPMTLTVGSSSALTATVTDQYGNNVADGTVVTFTTDLGDVGSQLVTKTITSGVATAELTSEVAGTASVTAMADSRDDTAFVTFQPDLPCTLNLVAHPMTLTVGDSSTLTATVKDKYDNNVADGTSVLFETSLGSLGSVTVTKATADGVATATLASQVPGTATVIATADPVSDTVDVTFEPGPPYTVTLEANPTSILVGGFTSTLTVTVTDQFSNSVADGTPVLFETSLGSLGSVTVTKPTDNGVATATLTSGETAGTAMITATAGSEVATTAVTFTPDIPDLIMLVADPTSLTVGETSMLTATVTDQYDNNVADGTSVLFETSLGSLGSVTVTKITADGIAVAALTSQVPGTATVIATADPVSDTVDVAFEPGPAYTVTLEAHPMTLTVGSSSALTATVVDQYNNGVADGTVVTFTTSLGDVGSNSVTKTTTSGVATAALTSQEAGTAVVTATAGSKYDTTNVTFEPDLPCTLTLVAHPMTRTVGESSTLTATVTDQYSNNVADGTSVLFETSVGSLGSVTVTKGTASGVATATLTSQLPGTATIIATADSVSDTVDVTFEPGPPYTVTLEANPTSILVGGFTSTLTVTVTDQFSNNVADGTSVLFETSLGSLGSITVTKLTDNGVATATLTSGETAGTAMITATADSKIATTVVTFTPDVPYTVTLGADPTGLTVGETSTLTATVKDQYDNNVADGTSVLFETSLGSLGSVTVTKTTADGIAVAALTSQLPGVATITATADSKVATTTVEFEPGPPYTVTLVAQPTSLTVGETSTLTATVKDQYDNDVADGTAVNFETSLGNVGSTAIAKTTVGGVATATLTSQVSGTAVVTATSDSKYDTANVTFNPDLPDTLTVEADPTTIPIGGFTSDVTATVRDQYDNLVADGTEVTLITDLGSIGSNSVVKATVNGVATATLTSELIIGTANITATSGSAVGQTQVIFTVGAPETVTAESWPPTIEVGGNTATITATVRDIGDYPVANGTPVVFTTDFGILGSSTVTKYTTDGVAVATLTSGLTPGVAHITATADSKFDTAIVKVAAGPPFTIDVTADPPYIPIGGATSGITATVKDRYDNNVTNGTNVDFITTLGNVSPSSDATDEGKAVTTLTSELTTGTARVTAISGPVQGWVDVIFTVGPPSYIDLVADPTSIGLNGQTSDIQATVKDIAGNYVADNTPVIFTTNLGSLGSTTVTKTTTSGVAIATLTSETIAGTAVITATADSRYQTIEVVFNPDPPHTVTVTADPMAIPANGTSTSAIRATVTDQYGNLVADGTSCYFDTTLGTVWPPFDATLNGVAETTLTSSEDSGTAIVTATCEGKQGKVFVSFYQYSFKVYLPVILKGH